MQDRHTHSHLVNGVQQYPAAAAAWERANPRQQYLADSEGIPWARYIDAIRRDVLIVLAFVIVGSGLGLLAAKRVKPTYDASATVWISAAQQSGPIKQPPFLTSESWVELLHSFAIVDPVVKELKLNVKYAQPRDSLLFSDLHWTPRARFGRYELKVDKEGRGYVLSTADGTVIERGVVGDSIGRKLGFQWIPEKRLLGTGRTIEFSVASPRTVAASLVKSVNASHPEDAQFLKIALTGEDPKRTARTVNAWAAHLVSSSGDLKKRHLLEFKKMLRDQLVLAERSLREAENQLERFRVSTITLPSAGASPLAAGFGQGDPVIANYFRQKVALDEIRSERASLERLIAASRNGPVSAQVFLQVPNLLNNSPQLRSALEELSLRQATLRTERQYLTDANPRIKQLAEAVRVLERETIPQIMITLRNSLNEREPELGTHIAAGSQQLRAIPARATEEMRLSRRVVASESLYNSLKARYEEVALAEAQTSPDLTVLDTAYAGLQSSNEAPRLMFLAIVASIALAIGFALIRDRLDSRFRYPEQATKDLGLSISGTVPMFKQSRRPDVQLALMSQAVEAFRTLRLALQYDFTPNAPIVLSVSSPARGDGKSLVASNLGLAFASSGSRTLLIDGDVRCGTLHNTFDVPVTPGLVDHLSGQDPLASIVRSTASENLFLIPRGTRRNRAPELLVSDLMSNLVRDMRSQFDVIIIDSPPLVAGIDAYALGAAAGSMVIVLRPAVTDRKLAAAKLEVLDRLPIRLLGAVINAVPDSGAYRYYGADYSYAGVAPEPIVDLATPKGLVMRG